MLTQIEIDYLLHLIKELKASSILLPSAGSHIELPATAINDTEKFLIDVSRKGQINISKATLQTRYNRTHILLRLDISGPDHMNPDGEVIPCPHLHIYKEGFHDKWAYPLPEHIPTDTSDLAQVLIDFLEYNNIQSIPPIRQHLSF